MNIPFLDLQRQFAKHKKEFLSAVERVVDRQFFLLGEELSSFEKEFAQYLDVKYVVGVGSGTDGLILSLHALGLGKGDEVITPANSFIATTLAITQVGATPIFVDCDKDTYQLDIDQVKAKITPKTKAILPVHLYGAPCDIESLVKIAEEHNLYLVEDAAQAVGATANGRKVGTFGNLGIFSFYPGKNLGAYGDGGAVATNDEKLYQKLLKLRNYGQSKKYYHDEFGLNSRLDEIQAAVLREKLKYLEEWNMKRREIAREYTDALVGFKTQAILPGTVSNYHLFVIESEKRDELQQYLAENGIHTLIHYPIPIHLQKYYGYLGHTKGSFPIAERAAERLLSIPMYSELSPSEVKYIISSIQNK